MKKTDEGRKLYEAELKREPTYRATGKPRTSWDNLPETAKEAWRLKAKQNA